MNKISFEWNSGKDKINRRKHRVSFALAQHAFLDKNRVIARDLKHSEAEDRYFCFGRVKDGILTVCFTFRSNTIRIISAGYWRKGKVSYEKENKIH